MADSETLQPVDSTSDFKNAHHIAKAKNPKWVAAGKAITEKRKQACEAQNRALVEAQSIIANNQLKQAATVDDTPASDPHPSGLPVESH